MGVSYERGTPVLATNQCVLPLQRILGVTFPRLQASSASPTFPYYVANNNEPVPEVSVAKVDGLAPGSSIFGIVSRLSRGLQVQALL